MIETQELFCLNGKLYQGYNQRAVETDERLCTETEIANIHDVDGSLRTLLDTRSRRLSGAQLSKKREMDNRRKAEIATERDALELMLLKRQVAALDPDEPEPEADPEPEPTKTVYACHCGKQFENPRGLNAHKMGAKH